MVHPGPSASEARPQSGLYSACVLARTGGVRALTAAVLGVVEVMKRISDG